jgi:hypothetical protein
MVPAVTGPSALHATRAAYDAVASLYAERFSTVLETKPMERALLAVLWTVSECRGFKSAAVKFARPFQDRAIC